MAFITMVGGEGFADTDEVVATDSAFIVNSNAVAQVVNGLAGDVDGKNFFFSSNVSQSFGHRSDALEPDPALGGRKAVEFSSLFYFRDSIVFPSSSSSEVMEFLVNNSNSIDRLEVSLVLSPLTALRTRLSVTRRRGNVVVGTLDTGVDVAAGGLYYISMRMISQSASNVDDGQWSLWVNGARVALQVGVSWSATVETQVFETTQRYTVRIPLINDMGFRNYTVLSGRSSALSVAPPYTHVEEVPVTAVASPDYTTVNAATPLAALTDGDDTTYIEGPDSLDTATLTLTPSVSIATRNVLGVITRLRAARGGNEFNTVSVEALDSGVSVDSQDYNVPGIGASVTGFSLSFDLATDNVLADDLGFSLINQGGVP